MPITLASRAACGHPIRPVARAHAPHGRVPRVPGLAAGRWSEAGHHILAGGGPLGLRRSPKSGSLGPRGNTGHPHCRGRIYDTQSGESGTDCPARVRPGAVKLGRTQARGGRQTG
eukprot:CAMPEP_0174319356 /NCGR_PEP_ID=MMETSP0810-20121108/8812_1 /TAXON_ID=73025 ORGANISM="Eutreptiella gymnastica-like, Strain CCMP1594" /NCGR_SAMPLE_ID=MMETSP0810 /ASSEMBLY_ACC=CAM_ASM_000659 /LENGTH=114 /DNA_ID=CAMNT_0015429875 /DNA_START=880 /DNA_END=1224 /DNA_ORIENTATION=+